MEQMIARKVAVGRFHPHKEVGSDRFGTGASLGSGEKRPSTSEENGGRADKSALTD